MSELSDSTRTGPGHPGQPDLTGPYTPGGSTFAAHLVDAAVRSPSPSRTERYQFGAEIGHGGMGTVLEALDGEMGRRVAVKVLLESHRDQPELARRFLEEARIAGRLQHPGVVPVYELGRLSDDRPFFAMKLVQGRTLAELLQARASPAEELPHYLAVFEAVCQAVAYAHSQGVIHRDLKPSNIMVGAFGEVQVMDWGLAKVLAPVAQAGRLGRSSEQAGRLLYEADGHTAVGSVLGTPAYMAPEQARAEVVDERADVFGLGAILCVLLTGKPPFQTSTRHHANEHAVPSDLELALDRLHKCGADGDLIALAAACLATEPEHRPRNAAAVAGSLVAYRESVQRRLHQAELERAAALARARAERWSRRLAVALAGAVLALVLLAAAGWYWRQWQQQQRQQHLAETARAIEADLRAADVARARAASPDDSAWAAALAAVRRAEGRLGDAGDEQLRQRVHDVLRTLAREQADQLMVRRLDDIRLLKVEMKGDALDWSRPAIAYQQAFREHGIEIDTRTVEQAGALLRASPIRAQLALALDDWSELFSHPEDRRRLRAIARLGDPDPTRQTLRRALESRDRQALLGLAGSTQTAELSPTSFALLGKVLVEIGEQRAGTAVLRQGQRRHPRDFWLNYQLATLLLAAQPAEAGRFYTVAHSLRPQAPAVLIGLGNALAAAGILDEAARCFEQASQAAPNLALPCCNLGNIRSRQGKYAKAAAAYRTALRLRPGDANTHNSLGCVQVQLGRLEEGIAHFTRATMLNSDHGQAYFNLGMANETRGDADRAIAAFEQAVRLSPKNPEAQLFLGSMLQRKGRLAEAVGAIRRADELGAKTPGWGYPSGLMLARAKRMLALEGRLPALLAGEVSPSGPEERIEWAELCQGKNWPTRAAALFREAFREKPGLADGPDRSRFGAAQSAALAGCGRGADADQLSDRERAGWRRQALEWLRADLARWTREIATNPVKAQRRVLLSLNHWRFDIALAGVRDPEGLKELPADERQQWRKFWSEVRALDHKAAHRP